MSANLMPEPTVLETSRAPRRFDFRRDSFAYSNELVWAYHCDPATGKMTFGQREPKPAYTHHCFAMARVARQFFYHARFQPDQPIVAEEIYGQRVRALVGRNPRTPCAPAQQIVIPGFVGLREFSRAQEPLVKAVCGGAWRSYFLRSHWRMITPFSRAHQARTAESLVTALKQGRLPILHLVKFPSLTINHCIVLFGGKETAGGWEFESYDPNNAEAPEQLVFDRATRTFFLAANDCWPGGQLNVSHIGRSWFF